MSLGMVDKSGEPRSDEEIKEALQVVYGLMLRPPMTLPKLVVHLGILKDSLEELLNRRQTNGQITNR